jgi:hypothetical protein
MADQIDTTPADPPVLGKEGTVNPVNSGDTTQVNAPTTPSTARGIVKNTTLSQMNNSLAHMCDFSQDIKKSVTLKKYIKAIAQAVRKGIRAVKRLLGLGDGGGVISTIIQKLKAIASEIRNFIKEYITPIQKFMKDVVGYIKWAIATVQWILSLPAKFIKLLADCLKKVISAIGSVFKDALAEAAAEDNAANPATDEPGMKELIAQAKDTLKAGGELVSSVVKTVGTVAATAALATTALNAAAKSVPGASTLTTSQKTITAAPTSLNDLNNANKSVSLVQASSPTTAQVAAGFTSATSKPNPKQTV